MGLRAHTPQMPPYHLGFGLSLAYFVAPTCGRLEARTAAKAAVNKLQLFQASAPTSLYSHLHALPTTPCSTWCGPGVGSVQVQGKGVAPTPQPPSHKSQRVR